MSFCGSYRADDVQFLLKPIPMPGAPIMADLAQKEQFIQTGTRHYSEMLSPETLPSAAYLRIFRAACAANLPQMAHDCLKLAAIIAAQQPAAITLVSLMRAGTPVGVILKHLLTRVFGRATQHYSVSIIRDRGIDQNALHHILNQGHAPESIVFVDGWTGKGVISQELTQAISQFNQQHHTHINSGLYVLADLAGSAAYAASCADYLIPSSILNATVSGLVSRSVLNEAIGPTDFHGCVEYPEFAPFDQSRRFADDVIEASLLQAQNGLPNTQAADRSQAAAMSRQLIAHIRAQYGISDINLIKPGIGEATRVLLRRVPRLLLLRDQDTNQATDATSTAHLKLLAEEKSVRIEYDPTLPYQALAIIRHTKDN